MSKFSVKKPLTVFVAVVAILVLGVVAYLKMTPDLLPNMDFPYIMIMTTYPGASPEKVEAEVTKPMEQSMSTLEHIKEVTSTSNENYSTVLLEFEESVNMDTIGVDIQQSITALAAGWDDMVGSPIVLKINPSMLPIEVAAVAMDGKNTVELTEFLNDTLMTKLEGIPGVARISTSGAVEQELHVVLNQTKIDWKNMEIADAINGKLDEAAQELSQQKEELEEAQEMIEDAKLQMDNGKASLSSATASAEAEISSKQSELLSAKAEIQNQLSQLNSSKTQLQMILTPLQAVQTGLINLRDQLSPLRRERKELKELQAEADDIDTRRILLEARIQDIYSNTDLTAEQQEAAVTELKNSAEAAQIAADQSALDAKLAARGTDTL